jgi:hypothetical protein
LNLIPKHHPDISFSSLLALSGTLILCLARIDSETAKDLFLQGGTQITRNQTPFTNSIQSILSYSATLLLTLCSNNLNFASTAILPQAIALLSSDLSLDCPSVLRICSQIQIQLNSDALFDSFSESPSGYHDFADLLFLSFSQHFILEMIRKLLLNVSWVLTGKDSIFMRALENSPDRLRRLPGILAGCVEVLELLRRLLQAPASKDRFVALLPLFYAAIPVGRW